MYIGGGNNDDNGLVMRLFGILVFVVDGPVMAVFLLEECGCGGLGSLLQTGFGGADGPEMDVFALFCTDGGLGRLLLSCFVEF